MIDYPKTAGQIVPKIQFQSAAEAAGHAAVQGESVRAVFSVEHDFVAEVHVVEVVGQMPLLGLPAQAQFVVHHVFRR